MQDTPAPEGDILSVEKGPEAPPLPREGGEAPVGPPQPEVARPGEQPGAAPQQPPTQAKAKAEAQSAGGQVAKDFFGTGPAEISGPPPSEPPRPVTRRVQSFTRSALRYTAVRKAGLEEEAT